jgi:STE24 endopeptidase
MKLSYLMCNFYPKMRVWCGITSIGFNLLIPWTIFFLIAFRVISFPADSLGTIFLMILSYFCFVSLINVPVDFLSGFVLEKKAGRYSYSSRQWTFQWLAGSLVFIILQTAGGSLLALVVYQAFYGFIIGILLLIVAAVVVQRWHFFLIPSALKKPYPLSHEYLTQLAQELFPLGLKRVMEEEILYFYESEDGVSVNGGSIGWGAQRRYMISSASAVLLTPRELALLIWRDETMISSQDMRKHFYYSVAYCVVGLVAACYLTLSIELPLFWSRWFLSVALLSSWFFLALFILPSYSRKKHRVADAMVINHGVNKIEYTDLLKKLQILNSSEHKTSTLIETVFHPIPTLDSRLQQLDRL